MSEYNNPFPLPTTVHRWKETGCTLASTLSEYFELCLLLTQTSEETNYSRTDLVSQLDSVLLPGGLFTLLSDKLTKSQEAIAKARNRLASPIYSFPSEILSKFFLYFVYEQESTSPVYVEFTVRSFYHRLHTLLGVCSVWRNVGLSMPMLWNLVPVIRGPRFSLSYEATSLSLNRSGTLPLDLALMIPYFVPNSLMADLTKHASRFRSINIVSQEPDTVRDILRPLLEHNTSSSLSELSLCVTQLEHIDQLGDEPNYMFPPDHEFSKDRLPQLLQSLTRLRFNGATFDWAQITFSTRLVELRIHSVFLGYDSFLHEFLRAISAASELQQLSLASITSFQEPNLGTPPEVRLPKLQSLVLDDLYFNTLSTVLRSIVPISHRLTLYITDNSFGTIWSMDTGAIAVDLSDFHFLFEGVPIDMLLLGEMFSCSNQFQLRTVLYAIQSLNTLKVENWIIDQEFCEIFTRVESRVHVSGLSVPKIRNLHLTNAKIVDQQGLKDLVLSHGLEQMLLGGYLSHGSGLEADWQPLMIWEELVEWLAENVPAIQLVLGGDYRSPEFQIAIWEL